MVLGTLAIALSILSGDPEVALASPTRADAAVAFFRVERAFGQGEFEPGVVRSANEAFDAATSFFFSGRLGFAARDLNALAERLEGAAGVPADPDARLARSLAVRVEPSIVRPNSTDPLRLTVRSLYDLEHDRSTLTLVVRDPAGRRVHEERLELDEGRASIDRAITLTSRTPGRHTLHLVAASGRAEACGVWCVTARLPSEVRAEAEARLDAAPEGVARAAAACRARAGLLLDEVLYDFSPSIVMDPERLATEVERESLAIARGEDPYRALEGSWFLSLLTDAGAVPYNIHVPPGNAGQPRPLVIALHGAGGDEHLFFHGYGGGRIVALADEHDFVALSPATLAVAGRPDALAGLIDAADRATPIDRDRVYVIGHSLGGMAASVFAARSADVLAGVVCLAGSSPLAAARSCAPTLIIGAELDPIIPARGLEATARRAADRGLPVEYREMPGLGHTLMVNSVLDGAIEWLLARER